MSATINVVSALGPVLIAIAAVIFTSALAVIAYVLWPWKAEYVRAIVGTTMFFISMTIWALSVTWHDYHHIYTVQSRIIRFCVGLIGCGAGMLVLSTIQSLVRTLKLGNGRVEEITANDIAHDEFRKQKRQEISDLVNGRTERSTGFEFSSLGSNAR